MVLHEHGANEMWITKLLSLLLVKKVLAVGRSG